MNLFRRNNPSEAVMAIANTKKVRSIVHAKSFEAGASMTKKATNVVVSSTADFMDTHRLNETTLYDIPMIPVKCSFGIVCEQPSETISLQALTKKERLLVHGADVTVVFAIRRPGCGACREHGLQLSQLAKEEKIALAGIIKETGVSVNDALLELYEEYFHYPIYKDEQWNIFHAMGGRRIPLWKLIASLSKTSKRHKDKGIQSVPSGGDGWTQGGVLIFDKKGRLRYAYYETYGDELDTEELRRAINGIRDSYGSKTERTENFDASANPRAIVRAAAK